DLQATMDMAAGWFDAVGVRVNAAKTVLLEWPQQLGGQPLVWRQGGEEAPITQVAGPDTPVRILGQYLTPRGRVEHLAKFLAEAAEDLVAPFERRWLTDRQAQYLYRAVLCPTLAYKVQGLPLTAEEVTSIAAPMMRFVKHKFGVPRTTPSAFFHARKGGRLPRLLAEAERRAVEQTLRLANGKGCVEARHLATRLAEQARRLGEFPGDMLAFPEQAACREPRPGRERCWWAYVTDILARRGVSIAEPTAAGEAHMSILAVLRPGWTAGGTPVAPADVRGGRAAWSQRYVRTGEAILDSKDGRAYVEMARSGITRIDQVFCVEGGTLRLCPGLDRRLFWVKKMQTQLNLL
ncbi:hypothetical protein H4R21_006813, partial [Coemansia helicoidea]